MPDPPFYTQISHFLGFGRVGYVENPNTLRVDHAGVIAAYTNEARSVDQWEERELPGVTRLGNIQHQQPRTHRQVGVVIPHHHVAGCAGQGRRHPAQFGRWALSGCRRQESQQRYNSNNYQEQKPPTREGNNHLQTKKIASRQIREIAAETRRGEG